MRWITRRCLTMLFGATVFVLMPQLLAQDQIDSLDKQIKQAQSQELLDQVTALICEAAQKDEHKYAKKCKQAHDDQLRQEQQFTELLKAGTIEFQTKDFSKAIQDLNQITFGPLHAQAQQLIQLAAASMAEAANKVKEGALLQTALAAYQRGDFDAAVALATQISTFSLKSAARQITTNVRIYRETMVQADVLRRAGNLEEARQKYAFALKITSNGPGDPADKMHSVEAAIAKKRVNVNAQVSVPLTADVTTVARIRAGLLKAQNEESKRDLRAALADYESVLILDSNQAVALAGKHRLQAVVTSFPESEQSLLEQGLRSFYSSDFEGSRVTLMRYLESAPLTCKGPAQFYLGAALLSESLLADPRSTALIADLRSEAKRNFVAAKHSGYKPVENLVSPKILTVWNNESIEP